MFEGRTAGSSWIDVKVLGLQISKCKEAIRGKPYRVRMCGIRTLLLLLDFKRQGELNTRGDIFKACPPEYEASTRLNGYIASSFSKQAKISGL